MRRGKRSYKEKGFTLLEVVCSLALAGMMFAIMQATLMQSVYTQKVLDGRITAAVLGQSKLAELEQGSEGALSGDFETPYSRYHWVATEETGEDGSTRIQLTVEWRDGNDNLHQTKFTGSRPPE